jgi:hypothetical protein
MDDWWRSTSLPSGSGASTQPGPARHLPSVSTMPWPMLAVRSASEICSATGAGLGRRSGARLAGRLDQCRLCRRRCPAPCPVRRIDRGLRDGPAGCVDRLHLDVAVSARPSGSRRRRRSHCLRGRSGAVGRLCHSADPDWRIDAAAIPLAPWEPWAASRRLASSGQLVVPVIMAAVLLLMREWIAQESQ